MYEKAGNCIGGWSACPVRPYLRIACTDISLCCVSYNVWSSFSVGSYQTQRVTVIVASCTAADSIVWLCRVCLFVCLFVHPLFIPSRCYCCPVLRVLGGGGTGRLSKRPPALSASRWKVPSAAEAGVGIPATSMWWGGTTSPLSRWGSGTV